MDTAPCDDATSEPGGARDPSFNDGFATVRSRGPEFGKTVAVQADGRVLAAGKSNDNFLMVRFLPNGRIDGDFGDGGVVSTDFLNAYDEGKSLVVQPDGRILLGGITTRDRDAAFVIARYFANGMPDPSFGMNRGSITIDFGPGSDEGKCLALQPDGRVVIAGQSTVGTRGEFALARVTADGLPDTSFGPMRNGRVTMNFSGLAEEGNSVRLQPDGKIVVAGQAFNGTDQDFAVARFNADGSVDGDFGPGGFRRTPVGNGDDLAFTCAIQSDGKIVIAGVSTRNGTRELAAARYLPNGRLDTDFATGGIWRAAPGSQNELTGVAIQDDGRIVLGGTAHNGRNLDFVLVRLMPTGDPDPCFGVGGIRLTALGGGDDSAYGLTLQSDRRILQVGETHNGSDYDLAVARHLP